MGLQSIYAQYGTVVTNVAWGGRTWFTGYPYIDNVQNKISTYGHTTALKPNHLQQSSIKQRSLRINAIAYCGDSKSHDFISDCFHHKVSINVII